jgi:hypothetical protein
VRQGQGNVKVLNIVLLILALLICGFLFVAYSLLLDFFPWGNSRAYVIWEPLVTNFIVPLFFAFGILRLFAIRNGSYILSRYIFLVIGFILLLPSWLGFDLEADTSGRWCGVITSLTSALFLVVEILTSLREIWQNKKDTFVPLTRKELIKRR